MKTANKIMMTIAGLVLLFATVTKSHQLLTEPILSTGFWESWEFFIIQIPLELGLAIWLLCGLFRKAAWLAGTLAFGFFIFVTLYKGVSGAASCGCFGKVHVNPWITMSVIDIPLFLGMLIFRPVGRKLLPPPWPSAKHFFGVAIPTFAIIAVLVPVLVFNKPPTKTEDYEAVYPDEWTGKEWPLLNNIDIADSLRPGISIVLLYHHDCPNCREAIPIYNRMANDMAGNEDEFRFAFIEAPPYGPEEESPIPPDTICLLGKLDADKEWYFITPLVVATHDSMVVTSWEMKVPQELDEILDVVLPME